MIDTNNSEWLSGLKNSAVAVKEKDALKAHSAELRCCVNGHKYFSRTLYASMLEGYLMRGL